MTEVKQLKVEEYNLVDFVMKIQQGIRDGYEVNDTSDDAPIQIGGAFHLIMREAAKPVKVVESLVVEASIDTTKLQEQLKASGEIEQMLVDSLVVGEMTTTDDFLMVSDDIDEALSSGIIEDVKIEDLQVTEERSQELSDAFVEQLEKDADKWDNKELGADEAYVETIEPPKEPTLDESLPKEEQAALQTKQPTKRGRK